MDIAQLRCFLAVADELHFGRAAVKLHLSPSPVSRAVGRLETELGVELFIRDHRNVTLTVAGRALQSESGEILGRFDSLGSLVRAAGEDKQRTVVVGGTHMAPPEILDRVVDLVRQADEDVKVKVVVADSAELLTRSARGSVDIALVHVPVASPGIEHRVLTTYHLAVAMRSDDPLAGGTHVEWSDVRQRGLMVSSSTGGPNAMTLIRTQLEERGIARFDEIDSADVVYLASLVRCGRGLIPTLHPEVGGPWRVFDDSAFVVLPFRDNSPQFSVALAWSPQHMTRGRAASRALESMLGY